jgi:hypothetical protein
MPVEVSPLGLLPVEVSPLWTLRALAGKRSVLPGLLPVEVSPPRALAGKRSVLPGHSGLMPVRGRSSRALAGRGRSSRALAGKRSVLQGSCRQEVGPLRLMPVEVGPPLASHWAGTARHAPRPAKSGLYSVSVCVGETSRSSTHPPSTTVFPPRSSRSRRRPTARGSRARATPSRPCSRRTGSRRVGARPGHAQQRIVDVYAPETQSTVSCLPRRRPPPTGSRSPGTGCRAGCSRREGRGAKGACGRRRRDGGAGALPIYTLGPASDSAESVA